MRRFYLTGSRSQVEVVGYTGGVYLNKGKTRKRGNTIIYLLASREKFVPGITMKPVINGVVNAFKKIHRDHATINNANRTTFLVKFKPNCQLRFILTACRLISRRFL